MASARIKEEGERKFGIYQNQMLERKEKTMFFSLFIIIICLQIVIKVSLNRENNLTLKILSPKIARK